LRWASAWRAISASLWNGRQLNITVIGRNVDRIPTNEDNLIYRVAQKYGKTTWQAITHVRPVDRSRNPSCAGMGAARQRSSPASRAYELLTGDQTQRAGKLFRCAFDFEDHPDKPRRCLYGGLIAGRRCG
jgi:homoserine kinase